MGGHFERRKHSGGMRAQGDRQCLGVLGVVVGGLALWGEHHKGAADFSPDGVWHADDGDFFHVGVGGYGAFYFCWGNVFASGDVDVFGSPNDVDSPIRGVFGGVTGAEPTVWGEALCGEEGVVVIAKDYSGAGDVEFTALGVMF